MYELTLVSRPGRLVASSDDIRPLIDAAVLGAVRHSEGYRIHARWTADGRWGAAGTEMHKLRYGIEPDGEVWKLDDSGVPSTAAGSSALYIDGTYQDGERNKGLTRRYSKGV